MGVNRYDRAPDKPAVATTFVEPDYGVIGKAMESMQKQYDALAAVFNKLPVPIPGEEPVVEEIRQSLYERIKDVAESARDNDPQKANQKLRDLLLDVTYSATSGTLARVAKSRQQYDEWVKQLNKARMEGKVPEYISAAAYEMQLEDFLKKGGSRKTTFTGFVPTEAVDPHEFMTRFLSNAEEEVRSLGLKPVLDKDGNVIGYAGGKHEFLSFDKLIENGTMALYQAMERRGELPYLMRYMGIDRKDTLVESASAYADQLGALASRKDLPSRYRKELSSRKSRLGVLIRRAEQGDEAAMRDLQFEMVHSYARNLAAPYAGVKAYDRIEDKFYRTSGGGGGGDKASFRTLFGPKTMVTPYDPSIGIGKSASLRDVSAKGLERSIVRVGPTTKKLFDYISPEVKEHVRERPELYTRFAYAGIDDEALADTANERLLKNLQKNYSTEIEEVERGKVKLRPGSKTNANADMAVFVDTRTGASGVPEFIQSNKDGSKIVELPAGVKEWSITGSARVVGYVPPGDTDAGLMTPTNSVVLSVPVGVEGSAGLMFVPTNPNQFNLDEMLTVTWNRMAHQGGRLARETAAGRLFLVEDVNSTGQDLFFKVTDELTGESFFARNKLVVDEETGLYLPSPNWEIIGQ